MEEKTLNEEGSLELITRMIQDTKCRMVENAGTNENGKDMFKELNPLLHSELRLAVMSLLISVEEADFVYIRQQTGATAGNLSVQIDKLSKAGYVEVTKTFKGKMPCTLCKITQQGLDAFEEYVEALKSYIVK